MSNKFKTKLKADMLDGLLKFLETVIAQSMDWTDEEKLLIAVLDELRLKLKKNSNDIKDAYTINFSPAQAFAIRLLYSDYYELNNTTYLGNYLHKISNEILKQYQ